jgi:membrane protease YdiL (CAAX protease family)
MPMNPSYVLEPEQKNIGPSHRALYVALGFVILSMIPGLLVSKAKPFAYIPPLVYIFAEIRRHGRPLEELGIKFRDFKKDLLNNWFLFLLVGIFLQLPIPLIAMFYWQDLLQHIRERIPFLNPSSISTLILTIIVIALFEELIYRGLLQQRLNWFLNGFLAIVIASCIFGLQHFTPGNPAIVAVDLAGVAIDGMVYGWIYYRSRSVFVSWLAHVAADIIGVAILMLIIY